MFYLLIIGFSSIALSMKRHHAQVFSGRKISDKESLLLKAIGFTCLVFSSLSYIENFGITYGLVQWTGMLTIAMLFVCLFLTYKNNSKQQG